MTITTAPQCPHPPELQEIRLWPDGEAYMFCTKCGGTSYVGKRQADSMTTLQERLRAFSVMGGTHERRLMIEAADALDAAENDKQAAVMAERERCANEAEYRDGACDICGCSTPMRIAAAIRRGE